MKKIIPVFPWPMHSKVAEALAAIPDIIPVEALAGGPGPILAIRKSPTFVADALVVSDPARLIDAVNIIAGNGIELVCVRDQISAILGGGSPVREFHEEPDHRGVAFR